MMEQQRRDKELELIKSQLATERKRLITEQKRLKAEQKRLQQEQRNRLKKEEARMQQDCKDEQQIELLLARLDELENRLTQTSEVKSAPNEAPESMETTLEMTDISSARAPVSDQAPEQRLHNRQLAIKFFHIKMEGLWTLQGKQIPAFRDSQLCREYLEYECAIPEYCRRFLTELPQGDVIMLSSGQKLTHHSDNSESLLPTEEKIRQDTENGAESSVFEQANTALSHLEDTALYQGIIEMRDDAGKLYWVTYRDLKEFAQHEQKAEAK